MNPRVKQVKAKKGYLLNLTFSNGERGIFDMIPYLEMKVFQELKDENYFKKVKPFFGSIRWEHGQDLCPDTLYMDSKKTTSSTSSLLCRSK